MQTYSGMQHWLLWLVIIILSCPYTDVTGQDPKPKPTPKLGKIYYDVPGGIETSLTTGRMRIFPDPNSPKDLFGLLKKNKAVQTELALSTGVQDAIAKYLEDENNYVAKVATRENIGELLKTLHARNREAIAEILTPEQQERLRELAYRFEVNVFGLPDALIEGRLGERVGIYENQHERISRRGKEIEDRAHEKIVVILKEAEEELLLELSPEQRDKTKEAMGDFFVFPDVSSAKELRKKLLEKREQRLTNVERK